MNELIINKYKYISHRSISLQKMFKKKKIRNILQKK